MIVCIADKHAMLSAVRQLAAQLLCIINHGNLSKDAERVEKHRISFVKLAKWRILVNFGG